MDARLQRRVQRYGWDKAAPHYEQFWAAQLLAAQSRMLEMAALQPGDRVLDVACGTGLVTFRAAHAVGLTGRIVATDISDEMVRSVRDTIRARGATNVSAERMDAEELRLPDASFDVALCALGLMYVPDPVVALTEMARVVQPRGRIAVAVWGARDRCGWAEIFPIVERRVASDVCPLFFQLGTGDTLRITMQQAGLIDIALERIQTTLHFESAEAACGAAFAGGPVALAYARFDDATRAATHEEYLTSIAPHNTAAGYRIPGEFVVASARTRSVPLAREVRLTAAQR